MKHLFAFLENILEVSFTTSGHTDYKKNEFKWVRIYPFRILSEPILHLFWNIKLLPKTAKKIKCIPHFQGILNWMLQILHHYCTKQHTVHWRKCCHYFLLFSQLTVLHAICLIQRQRSQVLGPSTLQKYSTLSTSQVISVHTRNNIIF